MNRSTSVKEVKDHDHVKYRIIRNSCKNFAGQQM